MDDDNAMKSMLAGRHLTSTMKRIYVLIATMIVIAGSTYLGSQLFDSGGRHWGAVGGAFLGGLVGDIARWRFSS